MKGRSTYPKVAHADQYEGFTVTTTEQPQATAASLAQLRHYVDFLPHVAAPSQCIRLGTGLQTPLPKLDCKDVRLREFVCGIAQQCSVCSSKRRKYGNTSENIMLLAILASFQPHRIRTSKLLN